MSNTYRILVPPGLPLEQHALYAKTAIADAEAREAAREARQQAAREREAAIKAGQEETEKRVKEHEKRDAERKRELAERMLVEELRATFFSSNPSADEDDFKRLLPKLKDQRMLENTRGGFDAQLAKKRSEYML
jgi:regulator of protease activity HflC (stomatin/prohibitin superfamily)